MAEISMDTYSTLDPCASTGDGCLEHNDVTAASRTVLNDTLAPSMCPHDVMTQHESLATVVIPAILLALFQLLVVGGNLLVIIAVYTCRKLRTITNHYVVSLAFADLMLGVSVLPFTGSRDILGYWPFGAFWCFTWLALDVWLCTASILNLCVISFDRYLAISRPFKYQGLMSPCKARSLVAGVWILAFIVCAPMMKLYNDDPPKLDANYVSKSVPTEASIAGAPNHTHFSNDYIAQESPQSSLHNHVVNSTNRPAIYYVINSASVSSASPSTSSSITAADDVIACQEVRQCELFLKQGYIIYSALGSFWIPVWIMAFFYWRIYCIAARSTESLRRGVLSKRGRNRSGKPGGEHVTLRVHRGGSGIQRHASVKSTHSSRNGYETSTTSDNLGVQNGVKRKGSVTSLHSLRRGDSWKETHAYAQTMPYKHLRSKSTADCSQTLQGNGSARTHKMRVPRLTFTPSSQSDNNNGSSYSIKTSSSPVAKSPTSNGLLVHSIIEEEETTFTCTTEPSSPTVTTATVQQHDSVLSRLGHRFRYINKEKKAAKTVGIIVGCFIMCWAPFFSWYLFEAFCANCTPPIVIDIFFWLGYVNSAINPCIYALFSKDFRFAFKKLLCCRCERRKQTFRERRKSRFRTLWNSLRVQVSSRSSDEAQQTQMEL